MTGKGSTVAEKYHDIRSDFWRGHFDRAQSYDGYLEDSEPVHREKWDAMVEGLPPLDEGQIKRLKGYGRRLNVLVYNADWCGDCVRQVPMIMAIAAAGEDIEVRIIDRDESEALKEELRVLGAMRVPVAVLLSEDFHEVMRFGDRSLVKYRLKLEQETGATCDLGLAGPAEELAAEQAEWVDLFERALIMLRLAPPLRERHGD
jgi:thiol-disulfide isomerase/thioredoxin